MKKLNIIGIMVLLMTTLTLSLTISEFKDLTEEELSDWDLESLEITNEGLDLVWWFEMNTFSYYEVDNTMREQRNLFSLSCYQELNCTEFYEIELEVLQSNLLDEYLELQDEL